MRPQENAKSGRNSAKSGRNMPNQGAIVLNLLHELVEFKLTELILIELKVTECYPLRL